MPDGKGSSGVKVTGTTEIRRNVCKAWGQDGVLVVRFSSEDAETWWGNFYERERIRYCVRHKRDNIPMYLRTGERPSHLKQAAIILKIKNLLRR